MYRISMSKKNNLENINDNLKRLNEMSDKLINNFKYKNNIVERGVNYHDYFKKNLVTKK